MSADLPKERFWRDLWTLLRSDVRLHLRDRLTLVLLFAMPLTVYPGMVWGLGRAQTAQETTTSEEVLDISAPEEVAAWLEPTDRLRVVQTPFDPDKLASGPLAAFVPAHDGQDAVLRYAGASERSKRARDRLEGLAKRRKSVDQRAAFAAAGLASSPDEVVAVEEKDVAGAAEQAGEALGRFLPILLVFLVVGGGAHTALDVVTGERERGTLETLLTARVDRRAILAAKFGVVLAFAALSAALSLLSGALILGFGLSPAALASGPLPGPAAWIAVFVLLIPLLVLLAAVLVAAASYAPNFRTGQALAMPLLMVLSVPAGVSALREVPFTPLMAVLPIANISLAIRSVLAGQVSPGLLALATVAALGWAALGLAGAARLIGREAVVIGPVHAAARRQRGQLLPEALGLFVLCFLLFWFFGQMAQARDIELGMLGSQVLLIAVPALAAVAWLALPLRETLSWRWPALPDLLLAVVAGLCAPAITLGVYELQSPWIPASTAWATGFQDALLGERPEWLVLLLFAVLPALCEETLFRGAILGLLRRAQRPAASIALSAALFGFLHLSAPRLLPTASLGVLAGVALWRSGALPVAMIVHAVNNSAVLVAAERGLSDADLPGGNWTQVALAGLAAFAVGLMGRPWHRKR